jgi:tetratricopeptide (TPR) repeat protein
MSSWLTPSRASRRLTVWLLVVLVASVSGPVAYSAAPVSKPAPSPAPVQDSTPTPAPNPDKPKSDNESKAPSGVDAFVKGTKAVEDLFKNVLGTWAVVVILFLLLFYRRLADLLVALTDAIRDRGVTLDVGTIVKVQVAERSVDGPDEGMRLFSRSPLEIDEDTVRDRSSVLSEVMPQIEFPVSDYAAQGWSGRNDRTKATAAAMRDARAALDDACRMTQSREDVRAALVSFVKLQEAARFLEAEEFGELLTHHPSLKNAVEQIDPVNGDGFLVLHCAGVAYAQRGDWTAAMAMLNRITWRGDVPWYVPAGDTWLACAYGEYLQKSQESAPGLDLDSAPTFFGPVVELLRKGRLLIAAMGGENWEAFPSASAGRSYYRRELLKVLGGIASIVGEYSTDAGQRRTYYDEAEKALTECATTIDGDPPSPLDHNNLADLYWQIGDFAKDGGKLTDGTDYYRKAHDRLNVAFDAATKAGQAPDPIFYNTRAIIFLRQRQPLEGLLALQQYGEAEARGGERQDVEQYIENQILAAKLAFALDPGTGEPDLWWTTRILEGARRFLGEQLSRLGKPAADKLQIEIEELLGFAYLRLPRGEDRAVEAFDRFFPLDGGKASGEVRWRCRLGRAKALTRLARSQRRQFSAEVAAQHRRRAHADLANVAGAIEPFGLSLAVPPRRRSRHFRLRLDTVIVVQALAEESFIEGERRAAQDLLEAENTILVSLRTALADDPQLRTALAEDLTEIKAQLRLCEAQRSFLLGRLLIRSDPSFSDAGLIDKVDANFCAARGINPDLECRIDLEFGELLLEAALAGKGEARSLYRRAVSSLQLAATHDAPALRAVTIRALTDAYARRGALPRKAKDSTSPK